MSTPKHASDAPTPRVLEWLTPDVRSWLYRITLALIPILVAYGILESQTAPLWIALAASVLSTGTALAHTPSGGSQ
ncbi:phage holin [Schaalia sp.]|uniref:phage holin n=1 Tax=Schaalia sp. TaxID=2691890 RepID=UPI003D0F297C